MLVRLTKKPENAAVLLNLAEWEAVRVAGSSPISTLHNNCATSTDFYKFLQISAGTIGNSLPRARC
mgnify:CR=1 FL=1